MDFYKNLGLSGKNEINKNKRLEENTQAYLNRLNESREVALQEAENKNKADLYAAANSYAMPLVRNKNRLRSITEGMNYQNKTTTVGMTEMISQVVEAGLLLDEGDLSKIYPEYKDDIRDIVRGYLDNANLNENFNNTNTYKLMEYVNENIPAMAEGISLTEDELATLFKLRKVPDVDMAIKNLGGNVSNRVATLMEKEQERVDEINNDMKKASKASKKQGMTADDIINLLNNEEISPVDVDNMLQNGEIDQATYDEVANAYSAEQPAEEAPAEEMPQGQEEVPAEEGMSAEAPVADQAAPAATPKKQIQMLPDGTMNINIYEEYLAEAADSALIKQRMMANGWSMSKQGQYDPEMLTAKGLGYLKSTLGLTLLSLIPIAGLPAAIVNTIRQNNNLERINSEQYKELRNFVNQDPKCQAVLKKIKLELLEAKPNKEVLKKYKEEFFVALKDAKEKYKETKLKEPLNSALTEMAIEEIGNRKYRSTEALVRETPRQGLIEALAVNEAMTQLKEGKEYNSDYCLAKAIMYITITETMSEMGIMNVDEAAYKKISVAAGGAIKEGQLRQMSVPKKADATSLNESMYVSWKPTMNNESSSFVDRILKRKMEASHNQTLLD